MAWLFDREIRRKLPEEWAGIVPTKVFIEEGIRLVEEAEKNGYILRLLGGLAIRIHSLDYEDFAINIGRYGDPQFGGQEYSDIDFMSYGKYRKGLTNFFIEQAGYVKRKATLSSAASGRQIYFHPDGWFYIDVFYDELRVANHPISFKGRLEIDKPTIPLTELLLEKIQIWQAFGEKDLKDVLLLLRAHDIGEKDDPEVINGKYIAKLLSKDWGFWYTATTNLKMIKRVITDLDKYGKDSNIDKSKISDEDIEVISSRIDKLLKMIDKEPKSMGWKMRSKIGTKKKWYNPVERPDTVGGFGIWEALKKEE
jgi:hypothetical protein